MFRETNCIKQIPKLLYSKQVDGRGEYQDIPISNISVQWEDQKEINTVFVMELIRILVEGTNQNTAINQVSLMGLAFSNILEFTRKKQFDCRFTGSSCGRPYTWNDSWKGSIFSSFPFFILGIACSGRFNQRKRC